MSLPLFFHPEADAELIDAARYYGERSLVGRARVPPGDRRSDRLAHGDAARGPGVARVTQRASARGGEVPVCDRLRVAPAAIRIIAIEYAKRRPGSWMHRVIRTRPPLRASNSAPCWPPQGRPQVTRHDSELGPGSPRRTGPQAGGDWDVDAGDDRGSLRERRAELRRWRPAG
jgi:hypothetical protein